MRRQSGWAARSETLAAPNRPVAPAPPAGLPTAPPTTVMLQAWAQTLSIAHFGTGFEGTVRWAPRLRYRAGDYTPATGCIRLSLPYFQRYGPSETRRILLHELCHWWLYRGGQHHRENTAAFQELLRRVGAPAKAHPLPRPQPQRLPLYSYRCPHCGRHYHYAERVHCACGPCCRAFHDGRYHAAFTLVLLQAPDVAACGDPEGERRGAMAGHRPPRTRQTDRVHAPEQTKRMRSKR